jgi:hypothetical protein
MGFREALEKINARNRRKKAMVREADEQLQIQRILEERQKSANERELDRFMNEEREEQIKEALEFHRKKRQDDIAFNHNPLNTKNVVTNTEWEVLKEKNMFAQKGNMFDNEATVMRNNPNLLKNNKRLCGL